VKKEVKRWWLLKITYSIGTFKKKRIDTFKSTIFQISKSLIER